MEALGIAPGINELEFVECLLNFMVVHLYQTIGIIQSFEAHWVAQMKLNRVGTQLMVSFLLFLPFQY